MAFVPTERRYVLWHITHIKYIFHVKIQLFVKAKSYQELVRIRIALVAWIRIWIRIEVKSWIRIRIGTNADPKHCQYTCSTYSERREAIQVKRLANYRSAVNLVPVHVLLLREERSYPGKRAGQLSFCCQFGTGTCSAPQRGEKLSR